MLYSACGPRDVAESIFAFYFSSLTREFCPATTVSPSGGLFSTPTRPKDVQEVLLLSGWDQFISDCNNWFRRSAYNYYTFSAVVKPPSRGLLQLLSQCGTVEEEFNISFAENTVLKTTTTTAATTTTMA